MDTRGAPTEPVVEAVTDWVLQQCELLREVPAGEGFQERLRASSAIAISRSTEQTALSASRSLLYELSREKVNDVAVQVFWKALMGVALAVGEWHQAPADVRRAVEGFLGQQN
ncbi:hypothetical protein ABT160_30030 [Streptomyces sp. NPDC001941]|uniref:hypothetical protein n=1 Tax=Streptomyces sp. NPDC001941 TaxID=3154659 RepID=UPI00331ECD2B